MGHQTRKSIHSQRLWPQSRPRCSRGEWLLASGEPINAGEHVAESLRGQKMTNEIGVNVVELDTRCGNEEGGVTVCRGGADGPATPAMAGPLFL